MELKNKIGKGAYVLSMLREFSSFGKQRYRLHIDGRPYDCCSAILTNGQYYGGSFVLSRLADITRQSIQVILFQRTSRWALLGFMIALLFGRAESTNGVLSLAANRVELVSPEGEVLQMDGDPAPPMPAVVETDTVPLPVRVSATLARKHGVE
jgi:diacylglycerol kinase family enzyme